MEFFNFLSQSCNYGSQYILTCALIFIAHGWTIHFQSIEDFDLFLPVSIMLGVFQIVIIGLGRLADNEENILHRYDNFVGWILVCFTIGLYIYFVAGIYENGYSKQAKVAKFYHNFLIFGSVYFFTFPLLMIISALSPYDYQSPIIEIGRIVSQCIGILYMARISTNKKGIYRDIMDFDMQLPTMK